jgi:hypothetical protein
VTAQLVVAGLLMGLGVWLHLTERHEHEHMHEPMEHAHPHVHECELVAPAGRLATMPECRSARALTA